jgi:hypothetical protein
VIQESLRNKHRPSDCTAHRHWFNVFAHHRGLDANLTVDMKLPVKLIDLNISQRLITGDSGIVDQNVEWLAAPEITKRR